MQLPKAGLQAPAGQEADDQRVQHAPSLSRLHAPASSPSGSGPSDADVLAITRIACIMFSAPGSSEEALSSAALTERLVILLRAAAATATAIVSPEPSTGSSALAGALGMPAAALGTGLPGPGLRDQVRLAAEAVQGLLEAEGALARAEAFPPRLMLQVLDALLCLGVFPSSLWLAACYKGLERACQQAVPAPPGQLEALLAYVGSQLDSLLPMQLMDLLTVAAALSSALLLLASRGVAAALPPDPWMASFCAASAPLLGQLGASELKQVLALVVLAQHVPTDDWMASAAEAATACLQPCRPPAAPPSATPWAPHSSSSMST
ncbi:hypothetical protein HaLaN_06717 [Haematococcus lacustris]|uniref:Uncharacterized protein n=1 Tax=Haematococcus lacustris TaxID=44745 RepID=A0A699YW14_HAELA|nr:hypothetical protein HaLaN_06717 [Haematococcus lacustris]